MDASNTVRPALNYAISSSCGSASMSSATETDIPNLSVTITTSGRPVWVGLVPAVTTLANAPYLGTEQASSAISAIANVILYRDSTIVGAFKYQLTSNATGSSSTALYISAPPFTVDFASAGTYTYKATYVRGATGSTVDMINYKLMAYEI